MLKANQKLNTKIINKKLINIFKTKSKIEK